MLKMPRLPLFLATLAVAAVALAACAGNDGNGGGETPGGTQPTATQAATPAGNGGTATTVNVTVSEWAVAPEPQSAPPGAITFDVRNSGGLAHELVVIRTDFPHGELPVAGGVVDEDADGIEVIGETDEFGAGQTRSLTLTLEPGAYALICNIPGHYPPGMHSSFTVE